MKLAERDSTGSRQTTSSMSEEVIERLNNYFYNNVSEKPP